MRGGGVTAREKFGLCLILALLVAGGYIGFELVKAREAIIRTQAETDAIQREVKARDDGRKERDHAADEQIADLKAQAAQVRTPRQAVAAMPDVSKLPANIFEEKGALPDAPSKFVIPQESIVPLYKELATCRQDQVDLGRCRADLKDADTTRKDVEQQRDKWEQTAKGGTKWQRVKRGMVVIGCAGAGGLAGGYLKGGMGAGVGAAAGAAVCQVFQK